MQNISKWTLVIVAVGCVATIGCRQSRKTAIVGGTSATISVTVDRLLAADQANTALLYEMSGCGTGTVSGTPTAGSTPFKVTFSTAGVKVGQKCNFTIQQPALVADPHYGWIGTKGMLYNASDIPVTESATGQLEATASMIQLYNVIVAQTFQVSAEVLFPVANPLQGRNVVTVELFCTSTPAFVSIGTFVGGSGNAGTIRFIEGIGATDNRDYLCNHFDIFADGLPIYRGMLDATTGHFSGTLNAQVKLGQTPITLVNLYGPSENGNIGISTETGECTPPLVFDVSSRTCACPKGTKLDPTTNKCI